MKLFFLLALNLIVYACQGVTALPSRELEDLTVRECYADVLKQYVNLSPDDQRDVLNSYLAAFAYMRRYEFSKAEPLLLRCQKEQFVYGAWDSPQLLLDRIATVHKLTPPFYKEFTEGGARLTVFGKRDKWLDEVYAVMPTFPTQANLAFKDNSTHINFYMFDNRDDYVEFFKAISVGQMPAPDQAGTGLINFAVFSEFGPDGSSRGINDLADRRGCVLHEYGHALCATVYGDDYLRVVPTWLNEGLADLIARPLFGPEFDKYPAQVARSSKDYVPLPYADFSHHFYGKGTMPYILARLMVKEIFGKGDLSNVGRVLSTAKNNGGDFDAAIAEIMHVQPQALYEGLIHKYWPSQR